MFRNIVIFDGEELLAPRLTPKLEDHPLSAARDCLFIIFAATLHIRRPFLHPQPADAPCCCDRDTLIMGVRRQIFVGPQNRACLCRQNSTYNYEVAPRILENLCTLSISERFIVAANKLYKKDQRTLPGNFQDRNICINFHVIKIMSVIRTPSHVFVIMFLTCMYVQRCTAKHLTNTALSRNLEY
jgi:hypothetical protein